jgi:hypothetical protein
LTFVIVILAFTTWKTQHTGRGLPEAPQIYSPAAAGGVSQISVTGPSLTSATRIIA